MICNEIKVNDFYAVMFLW